MRSIQKMSENVDTTGWATFATAIGFAAAAQFLQQFAAAMLTLIVGIIVAHFLKRVLHKYWPLGKSAQGQEND